MDSFQNTESQVLICECHSDEHQILIHYDDEDREVYLHVHLIKRNFWYRLWYGIKYVFGYKSRYGAWDSFIFRKQDGYKLHNASQFLNGFYGKEVDPDDLSSGLFPFQMHPATCDCSGNEKCERFNKTGEGEMIKKDGWLQCPCGEFKQHKL